MNFERFYCHNNDGNDLACEYITWRDLYMWKVYYWSTESEGYYTTTNDNGEITTVVDAEENW